MSAFVMNFFILVLLLAPSDALRRDSEGDSPPPPKEDVGYPGSLLDPPAGRLQERAKWRAFFDSKMSEMNSCLLVDQRAVANGSRPKFSLEDKKGPEDWLGTVCDYLREKGSTPRVAWPEVNVLPETQQLVKWTHEFGCKYTPWVFIKKSVAGNRPLCGESIDKEAFCALAKDADSFVDVLKRWIQEDEKDIAAHREQNRY